MPDWVIWVVIGVVLMNVRGRCCMGWRRVRGRREHAADRLAEGTGRTAAEQTARPRLAERAGGTAAELTARPRLARGQNGAPDSAAARGRQPALRARSRNRRDAVPETPLQALQRRFVSGALTMEQYEAELDKLARAHRL